jgi:hypothetical protein
MKNKELDLFKELIPAIDNNLKELYDVASEDGKKDIKGDLWNLNRYISSVKGSRDKQELAVFKTNEYYNKNWNVLGGTDHIKLQWQLLCVAGNTGRTEFHPWIGLKKRKGNTKAINLLEKLYPNMKQDEVELLARISTTKELKELAEEYDIEFKP